MDMRLSTHSIGLLESEGVSSANTNGEEGGGTITKKKLTFEYDDARENVDKRKTVVVLLKLSRF